MGRQIKPMILIVITLLVLLVVSGCNMSLSKTETLPATITIQPELPEATQSAPTEPEATEKPTEMPIVEVTAEVIEEKEIPTATLEPTATEQEAEEKEDPTATLKPTATEQEIEEVEAVTATPEAAPEEEEEEETETEVTPIEEATPIPSNANANPDATVFFYQSVGCYSEADLTSYNYGAVSAGTAGAAYARISNFYQVSHPNQAGVICWVTGDGVSPNLPAFNLSH